MAQIEQGWYTHIGIMQDTRLPIAVAFMRSRIMHFALKSHVCVFGYLLQSDMAKYAMQNSLTLVRVIWSVSHHNTLSYVPQTWMHIHECTYTRPEYSHHRLVRLHQWDETLKQVQPHKNTYKLCVCVRVRVHVRVCVCIRLYLSSAKSYMTPD